MKLVLKYSLEIHFSCDHAPRRRGSEAQTVRLKGKNENEMKSEIVSVSFFVV